MTKSRVVTYLCLYISYISPRVHVQLYICSFPRVASVCGTGTINRLRLEETCAVFYCIHTLSLLEFYYLATGSTTAKRNLSHVTLACAGS